MATTINSNTTDGLVITPDTSGEIKLQSAGTDIATVNSSGITMASGKGLAATGHVLQVVQNTYSTNTGISNTSYQDSGLTATITPTSASSKILVLVSLSVRAYSQATGDKYYYKNIVRGSTVVYETVIINQGGNGSSGYNMTSGQSAYSYLDSPATTSATTYKVQFKTSITSSDTYIRINEASTGVSTMILMEVAG